MTDEILTLKEVAEYLKLAEKTAYRTYRFRSSVHILRREGADKFVFSGPYFSTRFFFRPYVPGLFKVRVEMWLFGRLPVRLHFSEIGESDKDAILDFIS